MSFNSIQLTLASQTEYFTYKSPNPLIKIGRSLECDFNVLREELSREHCLIEKINNALFITDLRSRNGVYVNQLRIDPHVATRIDQQSKILLANVYQLKIEIEEIREIDQELENVTFELDIPLKRERRPAPKRIMRKERTPPPMAKNNDSFKMLLGFLFVLGVILYQAFGR